MNTEDRSHFADSAMAEDTRDNLSLTDDEDNEDFDDESHLSDLAGTLSKWTNYIHGWQDRYIVLKGGTLSYYKSEHETGFGCRGAVSLSKAIITAHEFDECRFDVGVQDCLWYLRARDAEERQHWIDGLQLHRQAESGYGSENSLRRHGSMLSLTSGTSLSTTSSSSFKRGRGLREKLAEMETFRDILSRQVDTLQNYFDACSAALVQHSIYDNLENDDMDDEDVESGHNRIPKTFNPADDSPDNDIINILQQHGAHAIDFKGESVTFKATTAGILATLSHCIELMSQREDAWRKRLEREVEKRKKSEEHYKAILEDRPKTIVVGGPDYEEGPHSMLNEEEFYDAVDASLDKLDKDGEKWLSTVIANEPSAPDGVPLQPIRLPPRPITTDFAPDNTKLLSVTEKALAKPPLTSLDPSHLQYDEINRIVSDHLRNADMTAAEIASTWTLVAEEGEMKVYKKDDEDAAVLVEPHKAIHTVKGITGHELCHHFWDPSIRMEWDNLLEHSQVLDWYSKDTVVSYQIHKRVWPATQRESVFWSTIRHCPSEDDEGPDYWIVANHTTDHSEAPGNSKCVRLRFNVGLICQTVVDPPKSGKEITRENLTCKIQYSANVNPGGWAPSSVIKLISKRELPKFIKTFTSYVQQKTNEQPILF